MTRQEQRRARRQNRIRRLERYKSGKTYHGIIKAICRRYRQEITTPRIYCSTDTGLHGMGYDMEEVVARHLMPANPTPIYPALLILDKSDAEIWKKASDKQWSVEWNPGGGKT